MSLDRSGSFYTFVGVREDGVAPTLELRECNDAAEALAWATVWLGDHGSCATAEVWLDASLIGKISLEKPAAVVICPPSLGATYD